MFGRFIGPIGFALLFPTFAFAQAPAARPGDGDASAPDSDGPLPPLPPAPPMYDAPAPPPYRFFRPSWAIGVRAEGVAMGREAASNSGMGGLGVSLRPRPTPHFAIDFGLDFLGGRDFYGDRRGEVAFSINPMVFVNPGRPVQVYFLGGINFSGAEVEHADQSKSHYRYVGLDAGVGLEFRLSRPLALDTDLVGFVRRRTDRAADESPEFVDPVTGKTSNSSAGGLARVGLAYSW